MWCRSVPDDNSSSRGQSGSSSDPDGFGIPSRSAPASTDGILIDSLEQALRELRADGAGIGANFLRNAALGQVERAIKRWRAEDPASRSLFGHRGRPPTVLEADVQLLLDLRKAKPGFNCRKDFTDMLLRRGFSKHRAGERYRAATAKIASEGLEA